MVELGLALFGVGDGTSDDPFVGFAPGSSLFEPRTAPSGEAVYATRREKLRFFNQQSFPRHKAPGTFRIFTLGGSTTYGRPYDDRVSFSNQLRLYLAAADPARRWEVINAGGISYASYRIAVLMEELVDYEPDLFVLYTGHNEFLEERTYSDILDQPPALRRLRGWLSGFRFAGLVRRALDGDSDGDGTDGADGDGAVGAVTLAPEVATRLESWTGLAAYERDDELQRAVVEHFRFNLGRLADMADRAGAGMVLVVPVSNLKDFSPFKSQPSAGVEAAERRRFDDLLARGRSLAAAGETAAAAEVLAEAVAIDPLHAGVRFELGRARLALARARDGGSLTAAESELVAARDLDVAPLRAITPLVEAVRDAAASRALPAIDLPALLAAEAPERLGISDTAARLPGDELLLDHVHPDIAVHGLIAAGVLDRLVAAGTVRPTAGWGEAKRRRVTGELVASLDRRYYAERDLNLAKVLGWAGKLEEAEVPLLRAAEVLDDNADLHLNLGILYQRTGRPRRARTELERAAALAPGSPEAFFNLGVVHGRLGDPEAGIEALRRAIDLRPEYAEAYHNLGVLLRERSDLAAAEAALRRALALSPRAPEVRRALALTLFARGREAEGRELAERAGLTVGELAVERAAAELRAGRPAEAERRLAELAREAPTAEVHWQHGMALRALGRTAEARAAYGRALAADPEHAPSLNNLGVLEAGAGDLASARRHLEEAVRVEPGFADAWLNLGVVRDQSGDPRGAATAVERAVALDPSNRRYRRALGLLYTALGETERAREQLEQAGQPPAGGP